MDNRGYHPRVRDDIGYHNGAIARVTLTSDLFWKMEEVPLNEDCSVCGDTSIRIYDSSKEVYHAIVKALGLEMGKKIADSDKISARFRAGETDVIFYWGLPKTCEVIYETETIPENEIVRTRKTVKEVICKESLMQSVFPDWVEEENGESK